MNSMLNFDEALEEDDWGLIISSDGELKGLFIPEGKENDAVPDVIVELCAKFFDIDINETETLH